MEQEDAENAEDLNFCPKRLCVLRVLLLACSFPLCCWAGQGNPRLARLEMKTDVRHESIMPLCQAGLEQKDAENAEEWKLLPKTALRPPRPPVGLLISVMLLGWARQMKNDVRHGNNPPSAWGFIGSGDSCDFFDLVLLDDENLIILTTQEPKVRDAIRERIEQGEPLATLRAEYAERLFSDDEIPIARIRRLEWHEGTDVYRVEYEASPGGGVTDIGGWLDESALPQLLAALEHAGKPVIDVQDEIVTAASIILFVGPFTSLLVGGLAWGYGFSLPTVIAAAAIAFVAVAAVLWRANREPLVGHVATFR